jgi:hypothetical protein
MKTWKPVTKRGVSGPNIDPKPGRNPITNTPGDVTSKPTPILPNINPTNVFPPSGSTRWYIIPNPIHLTASLHTISSHQNLFPQPIIILNKPPPPLDKKTSVDLTNITHPKTALIPRLAHLLPTHPTNLPTTIHPAPQEFSLNSYYLL